MKYPVRISQDTAGYIVTSGDFPELHSANDTLEQATTEAVDGLITVISLYTDERRRIPATSKPNGGDTLVRVPAEATIKVLLYNAMLERGLDKADIAATLGVATTAVDQPGDVLLHVTLNMLEAIAKALGSTLMMELRLI